MPAIFRQENTYGKLQQSNNGINLNTLSTQGYSLPSIVQFEQLFDQMK